jgi:hypothetical protein
MREAEECFVQPSQREQRTSVSMFSSHLAKLVFLENTGYCSSQQCCAISFKNQIFNRATYLFTTRKTRTSGAIYCVADSQSSKTRFLTFKTKSDRRDQWMNMFTHR